MAKNKNSTFLIVKSCRDYYDIQMDIELNKKKVNRKLQRSQLLLGSSANVNCLPVEIPLHIRGLLVYLNRNKNTSVLVLFCWRIKRPTQHSRERGQHDSKYENSKRKRTIMLGTWIDCFLFGAFCGCFPTGSINL